MRARRTLNRIHVWLGWLVGIPLFFWTVSGLWMAARPIEEVRGEHLKAGPVALMMKTQPVFPRTEGLAIQSVKLEQQISGPVWIVTLANGAQKRASARDGAWLGGVGKAEARQVAESSYAGSANLEAMESFTADAAPLDLRKERPSWRARFADGTHVYVDADTGAMLALRSGQWRAYDFMWGLHIMDLQTREEISHRILIAFAAIAATSTVLGLILLPLASRRRKAKTDK